MSSSSETDLDLTQPFEPSLEVDKSCNDDQLESDDDIFSMPTQPLEGSFSEKPVKASKTKIISEEKMQSSISVEDKNRKQGIKNDLPSPKAEICDMETQLFEAQLPTNENCYLDPRFSPSINKKKNSTLRVSRINSRLSIPLQLNDPSNSTYINSSESEDEGLLNISDCRASNPIHLVQETPLNKLKRDVPNISIDGEDFDATQKFDGFTYNESKTSHTSSKETPNRVTSLLKIKKTDKISNSTWKTDESGQLPQFDGRTTECISPILFEGCFGEDSNLSQKLDITEAETQLFTLPGTLNKGAVEVLSSASKPISSNPSPPSSTKNSSSRDGDSMLSPPPVLLEVPVENNLKSPTQKSDISEADTQRLGNLDMPFDLTEAETQPIVGMSPTNIKHKENVIQNAPKEVLDITEAETQLFAFSPPQVSFKPLLRGNTQLSVSTKKLDVSQDSSNSGTLIHGQDIVTSSPNEDSTDKYPTTQKLYPKSSTVSAGEDSRDECKKTEKPVDADSEDSSYNYPPTQKLELLDKSDENSSNDSPPAQNLALPEHKDANSYSPAQKLALPGCEDSDDDYPATQKLIFPEDEDSNEKYPPTQRLTTEIDNEISGEDSIDNYPPTQKLDLPRCEDSDDDYPATQKLIFPEDEDSNEKYSPTQKLTTEIDNEISGEDSNDKYPPTQKLDLPRCEDSDDDYPATQKLIYPECEDSNDKYPPTQKLTTEIDNEIIGEDLNDNFTTQKLVFPECEDSDDRHPPTQKVASKIDFETTKGDSNDDYPPTQRLLLESNHLNNLDLDESVLSKKPAIPKSLEIDQNKKSYADSGDDPTQPQSPVLDISYFDSCEVPSLKDLCSKMIESRTSIGIKSPMLYEAKEKEPDSSSMDIETQSFSPVFILDPPSEKDKSLKLETNQATRENQFNKGGDSSSMDIEPPSFSAIFPLTASQETAFKPETNQLINDVHHLLRSSTPIPDDLNKPPIKKNIIRKSDLVAGKKMESDETKTVVVEKADDTEDSNDSDTDIEVSFGSCLTFAVPEEPFVGFTADDTALSSKRMSIIQNAIVDEKREPFLPFVADNEKKKPIAIKVETIKKEMVNVPSSPRRLRSSQLKGETSMTTRNRKSKEEFKAPSRSLSLSSTRSSSRIKDRRGASVVIRRTCKDSLVSPTSISYGDKTNELIRGTTVRKQKGRQIKKEEETGEEDLSAKGESSMVSRCSVSSTERSPRLSQSRGRKRSRNNNNSTSAYSSNISDTPARRKKRALAGLVRVLFTGFDDENDRLIVLKLGGQVVDTSKHCSVLVTDKIRRTVKFLCAVGLGLPIVGPSWLQKSLAQGKFIDPWQNILEDKIGEKKFDFDLSASLHSACETPFLAGWIFHVTPNVLPPPPQMQEIIESCGGFYVEEIEDKSVDNKIVISCDQDKSSWAIWRNRDATLVSTEAILSGVLKQRFEPEKFKL